MTKIQCPKVCTHSYTFENHLVKLVLEAPSPDHPRYSASVENYWQGLYVIPARPHSDHQHCTYQTKTNLVKSDLGPACVFQFDRKCAHIYIHTSLDAPVAHPINFRTALSKH